MSQIPYGRWRGVVASEYQHHGLFGDESNSSGAFDYAVSSQTHQQYQSSPVSDHDNNGVYQGSQQRHYVTTSFPTQSGEAVDESHQRTQQVYRPDSLDPPNSYNLDQGNAEGPWPLIGEIDLHSGVNVVRQEEKSDFDVNGLNEYLRPRNEQPWSSVQAGLGAFQDNLQQKSFAYPSGPSTEPVGRAIKRPRLGLGTASAFTASDSGYGSFSATCGPMESRLDAWAISSNEQYGFLSANNRDLYPHQQSETGSVASDPMAYHSQTLTSSPHRSNPRSRSARMGPQPMCNICGKVPKNPSDARKHQMLHEKNFRCDEHGCTRILGFATVNDLDRHKTSVHHKEPSVGNRAGYICVACPASQGTPPKFWPRRDNFKAHIRRKHAFCNENDLLQQSESTRPIDAKSESGYDSTMQSRIDPHDRAHLLDLSSPSMPLHVPGLQQSQGEGLYIEGVASNRDDQLAGIGGAEQLTTCRDQSTIPYESDNARDLDGLLMLSNVASAVDSVLPTPQKTFNDIPEVMVTQHTSPGSTATSQQNNQLQTAITQKQRRSSHETALSESQSSVTQHPCPICNKSNKRECDLRKHMKRHTRPYGCTFPRCWKGFGSRNDWKRHEVSQHQLVEMWRCNFADPDTSSGKCGKLHHDRANFCAHLQSSKHQAQVFRQGKSICDLAETMRLGREGYNNFWCGFCNNLQRQPDVLKTAWELRFKHIGDHYDKDRRRIEDWVCLEANVRKGEMQGSGKGNEGRKWRKRSRKGSGEEEDSDLGEDGIPLVYDVELWDPGLTASNGEAQGCEYQPNSADGFFGPKGGV